MDHLTCITTIWRLIFHDVAVNQSTPKPVSVQNKYSAPCPHVVPTCQNPSMTSDRWLRGYLWRCWNHSCVISCTIVMMYFNRREGEISIFGHPRRKKSPHLHDTKIYKRNVSSFKEFSLKKLSWVFFQWITPSNTKPPLATCCIIAIFQVEPTLWWFQVVPKQGVLRKKAAEIASKSRQCQQFW